MDTAVIVETAPRPQFLSWRAIIAGAIVALSSHFLLTTLGAGLTGLVARKVDAEKIAKTVAIGTIAAWTLSALISLALGGYVAGRSARSRESDSGRMHGFIMWSVATVTTFALMFAGMGGAVAGAAGLTGRVLATAGTAAAAVAPDLIKEAGSVAGNYAGEVTVGGAPVSPRGKRQLATAIKDFVLSEGDREAKRQELTNLLVTVGAGNPQEAAAMVADWEASYNKARAELVAAGEAAKAKAEEVASATAKAGGIASIFIFVGFWGGALISAWAGTAGAQRRFCPDRDKDLDGKVAVR